MRFTVSVCGIAVLFSISARAELPTNALSSGGRLNVPNAKSKSACERSGIGTLLVYKKSL